MRKLRSSGEMVIKVTAALLLTVMMVAPVTAGAAEPLLGCFARTYDKQHLAQHPDQLVTAVQLKLYAGPIDSYYKRWFSIRMQKRGHKALHNEGYCEQEGSVTKCSIECDGGGVRVIPSSNSTVLMRLGIQPPFGPNGEVIRQDERIRMVPCGTLDVDDGTGIEVTGGKDDHEFLLKRANDAVCVGINQ
jgi:hypothetical protein